MLKRFPQKNIAILIISFFLMSTIVCNFAAVPVMGATAHSPYTDVNDHWAIKYICNLDARQVVTGYSDGTFQPDKQVTQLEATLMAVRNMDASSRIAAINSNQTLNITVPSWAETQFKKDLLFAVQEGLIVPSENDFKASEPATRAWMTRLVVRMLDKESEANLLSNQTPNYTDFADIPRWALGYVNAGVKYGVISGFPDNTFKPLQAVTRAHAATMLTNSEPHLNLTSVMEGDVVSISGSQMTVRIQGQLHGIDVSSNTPIFDEDGHFCSLSNLSINDQIKLVASGTNAKYIAILKEGVLLTSINGTVVYTIPTEQVIVVKDEKDVMHTKILSSSVSCIDQYGQTFDFTHLASGSQVELKLNSDSTVASIIVNNSSGVIGGRGIIFDIVPEQHLIILKQGMSGYQTYQYDPDLLLVFIEGQRFPSLDDLQIGDDVRVTADGTFITEIELVKARQELSLSGKVIANVPEKHILIIDADGTTHTLTTDNSTRINISGLSLPRLADIETDDDVTVEVENGKVTLIKVNNRSLQSSYSGTIVSIDKANSLIIFDMGDDDLEPFEISTAIEIVIDDDDDCDLDDLKKDMKASFELINDKIYYLEVDDSIMGTVLSINPDRKVMSIETKEGNSEVYVISNSVDVNIEDVRRPDLDDVKKGDTVKLSLDDEVVKDIDVQTALFYEVVKVYEGRDKLRVEDKDGDESSLYLEDITVIISGIHSPDADDFNEGDAVKCTYLGRELQQVELIPIVIGTITSVNNYSKTISVQDYDGHVYNYLFDGKCSVVDGKKSYSSMNLLGSGDRVKIQEISENEIVFYRMAKLTGNFISADRDGDKIYISQQSISYEHYDLASSCYIHKGNNSYNARHLTSKEPIDLYILDDLVYEIERR